MDLDVLQVALVFAAGIAAGFINVLAGGGSFLTLAALDFAGLPILLANGTNRVAVEVSAVMSVAGFRSKGVADWRRALEFGVPGLFGSLIGAGIASRLNPDAFERVVGVAMLVMMATMLFNSKQWVRKATGSLTTRRRITAYVVFFLIGIYGGAIQAGVGFFLTAALVMICGEDLVRTTFFKTFTVGLYTIFALAVFVFQGQVNWLLGLVLSAGSGLGAWFTSRLAVAKGEKLIRWVLIAMLAVLSVRYLGIIPGF